MPRASASSASRRQSGDVATSSRAVAPAGDWRVLLIEIVNADQFPGRISAIVPFVAGYLETHAVPHRWLRFALPTTNLLTHARDEVTLPDEDLHQLLGVARELQPTHILCTDSLYAPQLAALWPSGTAGVTDSTDAFAGLPGLPAFRRAHELENTNFWPSYAFEAGNAAARLSSIDNVYLWLLERCGHPQPVRTCPPYAEVVDERVATHRGCAFCSNWRAAPGAKRLARAPLEVTPKHWITRQIAALARSRGGEGRPPNALLVTTLTHAQTLRQCLHELRETRLVDRVQLLFGLRVDQAPWLAECVRDELAADPAVRCGVYASGLESFAASELERFNKGTTALQNLRALRIFRELAEQFPGRFSYTGLTFVLLTPWSTLPDLQLNLGLMQSLHMSRREMGNVFQARLRLHPDLAITALAEHDGLVVDEEADPLLVMNRRKLFSAERPWRFAEPRLRPLSRIMLRYDLIGTEQADSLALTIERHLRHVDPRWRAADGQALLAFTLAAIEVSMAEAATLAEDELLARTVTLCDARAAAAGVPAIEQAASVSAGGGARFRLGEERLDLFALVGRLARVITSDCRPLVAIDGVTRAELSAGFAQLASSLGLHYALRDTDRPGTLLLANDPERLTRRLAVGAALAVASDETQRAAARYEAGRLHGLPDCCAQAYAHSVFAGQHRRRLALLHGRAAWPNITISALSPFWAPMLEFVPCRPDCTRAVALQTATFAALGGESATPTTDAEHAEVFALVPTPSDDVVSLLLTHCDDASLRYEPSLIDPRASRLHSRLRAAERLELVPGQLRLIHDGVVIDSLTASHGLWHRTRLWHPEFTLELASAMMHGARLAGRIATSKRSLETGAFEHGRTGLRLTVDDSLDGAGRYVFHIGPVATSERYYRRVGDHALWYSLPEATLTPRAAQFARTLVSYLHWLERRGATEHSLPLARQVLGRLLERADLTSDCTWRLDAETQS